MNDISVRYYNADMPRAPQIAGQDLDGSGNYTSVTEMIKACLITGFGEVDIISGEIVDGICTLTVAEGDTFPEHSTVSLTGVNTPAELNGTYKVVDSSDDWFSFETELSNGFVQGDTIKAKYAPVGGWTQPWSTKDSTTVLRTNPSTTNGHYLQLMEDSFESIKVHGFRKMHNRYGGTAMAPPLSVYDAHHWGKSNADDLSPRQWVVVASEQMLYVFIKCWAAFDNFNAGYSVGAFGDFIWELKPELNNKLNTVIFGKSLSYCRSFSAGTGFGTNLFAPSNYWFLLKDVTWGDVKNCSTYVFNMPHRENCSGQSGPSFPDVRHGGMNILPYYVVNNDGQMIGRLPGVYFINNDTQGSLTNGSIITNPVNNRSYLVVYTLRVSGSQSNLSDNPHNSGTYSCVLIDITGPWE